MKKIFKIIKIDIIINLIERIKIFEIIRKLKWLNKSKITCLELNSQTIWEINIDIICMVLFVAMKLIDTHPATCDLVVLVFSVTGNKLSAVGQRKRVSCSGPK